MNKIGSAVLKEQIEGDTTLNVSFEELNGYVLIRLEGYGDACSADGCGRPLLLELYKGVPRLIAWGDINDEEYTACISLEKANESNRFFNNHRLVTCVICGRKCLSYTAHKHTDGWIGECCWQPSFEGMVGIHKVVTCSICGKYTPKSTAHLHQDSLIGDCCWDELKASE